MASTSAEPEGLPASDSESEATDSSDSEEEIEVNISVSATVLKKVMEKIQSDESVVSCSLGPRVCDAVKRCVYITYAVP